MKQLTLISTTLCVWLVLITAAQSQRVNYIPPNGYVPDAKTAIQIAVAVWSPIYGGQKIQDEKPYHVVLSHGVWTVTGSLPMLPHRPKAAGMRYVQVGGVALAKISKKDGRILMVIHGV